MDEFGLEIDVDDISELPSSEFIESFSKFFNKVNYARTRFALRKQRFQQGVAGTPLFLKPEAKNEITDLIVTIRKIVNQSVADERKKNAIFRKLGALQEEIDRDLHTYDSIFKLLVDVSKVVGQSAENLEPLVEKLERLKKIFFESTESETYLPKSETRKQLPKPKKSSFELDDEIPF